ncbi:hypothetical protein RF641_11375 [Arthrobacter sp. LS16]|uniref:hypothetical protein n=1 Tax=unclassified Arthrobacter TaxID=235627 RepID=UPI00160132D9|nr:hypothetical protein [Arthrobacter sp. AG1021]
MQRIDGDRFALQIQKMVRQGGELCDLIRLGTDGILAANGAGALVQSDQKVRAESHRV